MKHLRWSLAASMMVLAGALAGGGVANARGGSCIEDPQDCGSAPTITNASVTAIHPTHAHVSASISPGDQETSYQLWISYAPCQGGAGECPKPIQKEEIASGSIIHKKPHTVKAMVNKLTPGCTYGFWFVAQNERGTVESEPQYFTAAGGEPHSPKECSR